MDNLNFEKIGSKMWVAGNFQIVRQDKGFSCRYKNQEFVWVSAFLEAKDECSAMHYAQINNMRQQAGLHVHTA